MRVFLTSPWIPAEWVRAHGFEPRGLWFEDDSHSPALPFSAGVCAFAEQAVQLAEKQPDAAVIFTSTCDQLRRGFDAAIFRGRARAFLFNIPATQTPAAKQIYRAEVERLGRFLLDHGGSAPTPDVLRREMFRADEFLGHLLASAATAAAAPEDQAPLALVGGPLCLAHQNIFAVIEAAGSRVVLNACENGERGWGLRFNLDASDPFEALVTGYFENIVDAFQRPNTRLYAWLKPRLWSRRVRGIVLWHFTGCDLWRAEAQTLREAFGLPVLPLEAGEAAGLSPRDVTRLQAFVETLK